MPSLHASPVTIVPTNDGGAMASFAAEPRVISDLIPTAITGCGFDDPKVDLATRVVTGTRRRDYHDPLGGFERSLLEVKWEPGPEPRTTHVLASLFELSGARRRIMRGHRDELERFHIILADLINRIDERPAVPHSPVIRPGESFDGRFSGNLRDYSQCANLDEVHDLTAGTLPLGRYAFGPHPGAIEYGPCLFLNEYRSGGLMEYNGTLLCAPQNSGKTSLIVRWAVAANRAGSSVFLIDVKGNLHKKLSGKLQGKVFHFSTDPKIDECDRINFLSQLDPTTAEGTERIQGIVAALLPSPTERSRGDEEDFHYRNRVVWLSALIHLVKLLELYQPDVFQEPDGRPRSAELCDLYTFAVDEAQLANLLTTLRELEQLRFRNGLPLPHCGADHWGREIACLLHPDRVPGGQRDPHHTYRDYTQGIVSALEPFSRHGTLCRKVADHGEGELFSLADLGRTDEPVTIIIAARVQDLEKAETILAMAVREVQHYLFERVNDDKPRPVLLLLDETRRIRTFEANKFITFSRESKAGCVVAYQSLDQIGDERAIFELLENVGTAIYLGSLVANTAKYFIATLPKRYRPSVSTQTAYGPDGTRRTESVASELVEWLTANELYNLPSGNRPALIYLNDQPRRRPILVDMDESL